jgi:hypothetical protein
MPVLRRETPAVARVAADVLMPTAKDVIACGRRWPMTDVSTLSTAFPFACSREALMELTAGVVVPR